MRRFTIIHPLFMSFFSRSLYQDVAENWKGICIPYLLSLLALCTIPGVMKLNSDLSAYLAQTAPAIVRQVPVITVTKGKLSIDKPEPYIIKDEKTGAPVIIIDTTGRTNSLEGSPAVMLIKQTEILVRKDGAEAKRFELDGIEKLVVDRRVLYEWMDAMEESFVFVLYPFAVLFSFIYHFLEVLLFAGIGLLVARRLKIPLAYKTLVRLAAISVSPSIILGALLAAADLMVPYRFIIGFWISMGYLIFAVRACEDKTKTAVT